MLDKQLFFKEKSASQYMSTWTTIYNDYMYMYTHKVGYMVNNHNRCVIFNIWNVNKSNHISINYWWKYMYNMIP